MLNQLITNETLYEIFWVLFLAVYAVSVIFLTKKSYHMLIKKGIKKESAIYYNRKLIHIFAGGVVVLAVPFVFSTPWYPLLSGIVLALIMYFFHKSGKILYWFQTKDDVNDVNFCFMWGLAVFILWWFLDNPWVAIIPPAFMAFGDGITGIIRNIAFKERVKHVIGNVYMMGVCIPIGYYFGSMSGIAGMELWGVIAAIVASILEKFEIGPLDDNVLITVSSIVVISIGWIAGPIL
jgi:hypothetical protein